MKKENQILLLKQLNEKLGNKGDSIIKVGSKLEGKFNTMLDNYTDHNYLITEDENNIYIVEMDKTYTEEIPMTEKESLDEFKDIEDLVDFFTALQIKVIK